MAVEEDERLQLLNALEGLVESIRAGVVTVSDIRRVLGEIIE